MTPIKGETYFYQGWPVTIMRVASDGRCLIRAGDASKNLDTWVTWEELGGAGMMASYAKGWGYLP